MIRLLLLLILLVPTFADAMEMIGFGAADNGYAAQRLYLPGTNATSPTITPSWEWTTAYGTPVRRYMNSSKESTYEGQTTYETYAGWVNFMMRQYISHPLNGAQTITGTVKGQLIATEYSTSANFHWVSKMRVMSGDGTTNRGYLLGETVDSTELNSGKMNRSFLAGNALTSVDAQDGDRIVIDIGIQAQNSSSSSYGVFVWWRDNGASDLPEDDTDTDETLSSWIEFSQTLNFRGE